VLVVDEVVQVLAHLGLAQLLRRTMVERYETSSVAQILGARAIGFSRETQVGVHAILKLTHGSSSAPGKGNERRGGAFYLIAG